MDTSNVNELKRKAKSRCDLLREQIEESGGGATEVELTVIEAKRTIELIEELVANLKD